MSTGRWSKQMVVLHWVSAAMIVGLVVVGFSMTGLAADDPRKLWVGRLHSMTGAALGLLTLARLLVRRRSPSPGPLPVPELHRKGVGAVHALLYLVVLGLALSGGSMRFGTQWHEFMAGDLPTAPDLSGFAGRQLHELLAFALVALVGVHVTGVLVQELRAGGALRRMVPFLK